MPTEWRTYAGADAAAAACARAILTLLAEAEKRAGLATLAVSGGKSPLPMFRALAAEPRKWDHVHVFWVDERMVPPDDEQSNYRLVEQSFLGPARFPPANVHRVPAELSPQEAAARYASGIRSFFGIAPGGMPRFDVIHRGMGADAHTASLFPGEPLIDDREGIAAAVWVEKLAGWRVTLLPGVLLAAHDTVVLAAGADKATALRNVLEAPYEPRRYPAQLGTREGRGVTWFPDSAAAALLAR
jgi:6-phosphogluconolactonase